MLQGKDVFCPGVLIVSGYVMTSVFSIYNYDRWKTKISPYMLFLVFVGMMAFLIMDRFQKKMSFKKKFNTEEDVVGDQLHQLANSSFKVVVIISIIICVIATIVVYREMVRIAYSDFKAWGNVIYNYKKNKALFKMNIYGRLSQKITKSFAFIFAFVFSNRITENKRINRNAILSNAIYIIPGLLYIIQQTLLGVRIGAIGFIISIAFFAYYCFWKKNKRHWSFDFLRFVKLFIAVFIIGYIFFKVRELVGRQQETKGLIDYISTYLGGSFDLFSQYLYDHYMDKDSVEVFSGIVNNIQTYFGVMKDVKFTTVLEFRDSPTGVNIGNVYTSFRSYYNDFGLLGVVLLSGTLSVIFSGTYFSLIRAKTFNNNLLCKIILYGMLLYCIPFHFFTDYFYSLISLNMLMDFALTILFCKILFKRKHLRISNYSTSVAYSIVGKTTN